MDNESDNIESDDNADDKDNDDVTEVKNKKSAPSRIDEEHSDYERSESRLSKSDFSSDNDADKSDSSVDNQLSQQSLDRHKDELKPIKDADKSKSSFTNQLSQQLLDPNKDESKAAEYADKSKSSFNNQLSQQVLDTDKDETKATELDSNPPSASLSLSDNYSIADEEVEYKEDDQQFQLVQETPPGARDGTAWILVEQTPADDHPIDARSEILHRSEGDGQAFPEIVRQTQPDPPLSDYPMPAEEEAAFIIQAYTGDNIRMNTRTTQSDWEWVEDMICGNNPCVIPVPKLMKDFVATKPTPRTAAELKAHKPKKKKSKDSEKEKEPSSSGTTFDVDAAASGEQSYISGQYIPESEETAEGSHDEESVAPLDSLIEAHKSDEEIGKELLCEFCQKALLPFPTLEQQQNEAPENLFCCEEYRAFFESTIEEEGKALDKASSESLMIDIKPHPHYGSVAARKLARERAQQKQAERIILKHVRSQNLPFSVASQLTFGRQMKTINYQLSSKKCMEEGWTVPDFQNDESDEEDIDIFVPTALQPGVKPKQVHKTYKSGKSFFILFEDGSGTVYYPSGQPAIIIIPVVKTQFFYLIQADTSQSEVLGVFDPSGIATCCYGNGKVRMNTDAVGGVEYDVFTNRRRIWKWHELEPHVHAPPLQPITLSLSSHLCLRVHNQKNILLTFSCQKRTCCFNVGTKLKILVPKQIPGRDLDPNIVFLDDKSCRVQAILDKVNNLIRLSRSIRANQILPPLYLSSKMKRIDKIKYELEKSQKKNKLPPVTMTIS